MVKCETCLEWYHFTCVGYKPDSHSKSAPYSCQTCIYHLGSVEEELNFYIDSDNIDDDQLSDLNEGQNEESELMINKREVNDRNETRKSRRPDNGKDIAVHSQDITPEQESLEEGRQDFKSNDTDETSNEKSDDSHNIKQQQDNMEDRKQDCKWTNEEVTSADDKEEDSRDIKEEQDSHEERKNASTGNEEDETSNDVNLEHNGYNTEDERNDRRNYNRCKKEKIVAEGTCGFSDEDEKESDDNQRGKRSQEEKGCGDDQESDKWSEHTE